MVGVLLLCGGADARKKDLAGKIENGIYQDDTYGFSLAIPDGWNSAIKKEKDRVRLTLIKKQYDVPQQFQHAPNYTTIPKVTVYADTTSLGLEQFVDSLLSDKYKSKQKNDILSEFKALYGNYNVKKKGKIPVGELTGYRISGQTQYTIEVQRSGSESDKADVVTDFWGGSVFFYKDGNNIIMMHFISEWRYFDALEPEFMAMLNGFKMGNQPSEKK
jgi:uncharacterized protein (UPF0297 family)